jgi:hypothetical protein
MVQAYSRLRQVLDERKLKVPELHRRIQEHGLRVNRKSLYRLCREDQPVQRLDLRVAGVICEVCRVPLADLIAFAAPSGKLRRLPAAKQRRLDTLMDKNNEGQLSRAEQAELRAIVAEAEELTLSNARMLAGQRKRLSAQ